MIQQACDLMPSEDSIRDKSTTDPNSLSNYQKQECQQLYEYLQMRFSSLRQMCSTQLPIFYPQLNPIYRQDSNYQLSLLDLFIENPFVYQNDGRMIPLGMRSCQQEKHTFIQSLSSYYPEIFTVDLLNNSKEEKINKVQKLICQVIKTFSVAKVAQIVLGQEDTNSDILNTSQEILLPLDLLINSFTIQLKQPLDLNQKQSSLRNIGQKVVLAVEQTLTLTVNQEQQGRYQEIKGKVAQIVISRLNLSLINLQKSDQQFIRAYQQFVSFYEVLEMPFNKNIIQLHHIQQILQLRNNFKMSFPNSSADTNQNDHLELVNIFNLKCQNHQSKPQINQKILRSFLVAPYQTSLFVLYRFLQNSQIKNINKFFDSKANQKHIDPLIFLLIDKKLITFYNSQTFSLSLWIVFDVWVKFVQRKVKQKLQRTNFSVNQKSKQTPNNYGNFINTRNSQSVQHLTSPKDPRRIYAIRQQSYPSIPQASESKQQNTHLSGQIQIKSLKQFQDQYKRPLMYTLTMFLLTLDMQTTMLKYFPIQNDLIKQMIQGDLFPTLLVKNRYLFQKAQTQNLILGIKQNSQAMSFSSHYQEQLLKNIESAQNLQQLQTLQHSLRQYETRCQKQDRTNCISQQRLIQQQYGGYSLPWMCLIQSKQIIFALLTKPYGYQLALKTIQRHPYTFEKLYQSYIPRLIFSGTQTKTLIKNTDNNTNQSSINTYRFKGNKNVISRKSIDYSNANIRTGTKKQHSNKQKNIRQEGKMEAIKQIIKIYKEKSKDSIVRKACSKFIQLIE